MVSRWSGCLLQLKALLAQAGGVQVEVEVEGDGQGWVEDGREEGKQEQDSSSSSSKPLHVTIPLAAERRGRRAKGETCGMDEGGGREGDEEMEQMQHVRKRLKETHARVAQTHKKLLLKHRLQLRSVYSQPLVPALPPPSLPPARPP
jgi:hypothetical protein